MAKVAGASEKGGIRVVVSGELAFKEEAGLRHGLYGRRDGE